MSALSRKLRSGEGGRLLFWCPGCDCPHHVSVGDGPGPRWDYNGDPHAPTFRPSVLVRSATWEPPVTPENMDQWRRAPWPQEKIATVCHSFVTDGQIHFLGDCSHALANQTVDIPDFDNGAQP